MHLLISPTVTHLTFKPPLICHANCHSITHLSLQISLICHSNYQSLDTPTIIHLSLQLPLTYHCICHSVVIQTITSTITHLPLQLSFTCLSNHQQPFTPHYANNNLSLTCHSTTRAIPWHLPRGCVTSPTSLLPFHAWSETTQNCMKRVVRIPTSHAWPETPHLVSCQHSHISCSTSNPTSSQLPTFPHLKLDLKPTTSHLVSCQHSHISCLTWNHTLWFSVRSSWNGFQFSLFLFPSQSIFLIILILLLIIIIIMYSYYVLINTLSAHLIHINLNMIF